MRSPYIALAGIALLLGCSGVTTTGQSLISSAPSDRVCVSQPQELVSKRVAEFTSSCYKPKTAPVTLWSPGGTSTQQMIKPYAYSSERIGSQDRFFVSLPAGFVLAVTAEPGGADCTTEVKVYGANFGWKEQVKALSTVASGGTAYCNAP